MKTTLICTVLNEEQTVNNLINSIVNQTKNPDEVIIVDGGSTDNTFEILQSLLKTYSHRKYPCTVLQRKGNRSVGRNFAIQHAKGDVILSVDAGCILDKNWVHEITKPFQDKSVDVVAGYYTALSTSIFQKCVVPYALVMEDRVNPNDFLPATRSMAFKKSVWEKIGGFNVLYSHNEDYVFAHMIKKHTFKIVFSKNATVQWIPPKNIASTYRMLFRFAYGDAESGMMRIKVLLQFFRYTLGFILLFFALYFKSLLLFTLIFFGLISYILWAVIKNYKYVNKLQGFFILPLLQFIADFAVISGSTLGFIQKLFR